MAVKAEGYKYMHNRIGGSQKIKSLCRNITVALFVLLCNASLAHYGEMADVYGNVGVFPEALMNKEGEKINLSKPYWSITEKNAADIKQNLSIYMQHVVAQNGNTLPQLMDMYWFQFLPCSKDGQKMVFINAHCTTHLSQLNDHEGKFPNYLKEHLLIIEVENGPGKDGCYYHLNYNFDAGTFDGLKIF